MDQLFLQSWNPNCITTPRFMEAQDFIKTEKSGDHNSIEICICGKSFENDYGTYTACKECEQIIDEQQHYHEGDFQ